MLTKFLRFPYRVRKSNPLTQNKISFIKYKRDLTEARKRITAEAAQYYDQAENQFLEQHMKKTKNKHQSNVQKFRQSVVNISYSLYNSVEGFQKMKDVKNEKLAKYIHEEQVKNLNRERIKKIISYEAEEYWFSGEKIKKKLDSNLFFPPYLGSTDYYHKLYSQALMYEMLDFEGLQKSANTSFILGEKNRQLIPLYQRIRKVIYQIKNDELSQIEKKYELNKIKISQRYSDKEEKMKIQLKKCHYEFLQEKNTLQENFKDKQWRNDKMTERLRNLLYLFKIWKDYTSILSMTTIQIVKMMEERNKQESIEIIKKQLVAQNQRRQNPKSVSAIEEDTDDEKESDLESYIAKNQPQIKKDKTFKYKQSDESELEALFHEQEKIKEEVMSEIEQFLMENKIQTSEVKLDYDENMTQMMDVAPTDFTIGKSMRLEEETTTTVESLKEDFEQEPEVVELLNQLGEVIIDYPRLFRKIWDKVQ